MNPKPSTFRSWLAARLVVEPCEDRTAPASLASGAVDVPSSACSDDVAERMDDWLARDEVSTRIERGLTRLADWADDENHGHSRSLNLLRDLLDDWRDVLDEDVKYTPVPETPAVTPPATPSTPPSDSTNDEPKTPPVVVKPTEPATPVAVKPKPKPAPEPEPQPEPEEPEVPAQMVDADEPAAPPEKPEEVARAKPNVDNEGNAAPVNPQVLAAATDVVVTDADAAATPLVIEGEPRAAAVEAEPTADEGTLKQFAQDLLNWALPGVDAADLVARFAPFESTAVEESIDRFLDRLRADRDEGTTWFTGRNAALLSVGLVAGLSAGEFARRKKLPQRVSNYLSKSKLKLTTRTA